jgi:hypothetical protein
VPFLPHRAVDLALRQIDLLGRARRRGVEITTFSATASPTRPELRKTWMLTS